MPATSADNKKTEENEKEEEEPWACDLKKGK